jgi:hypothetical protein
MAKAESKPIPAVTVVASAFVMSLQPPSVLSYRLFKAMSFTKVVAS